jgi:hypothetical protein
MRNSSLSEKLCTISGIVRTVDGPIVAGPEHDASTVAVADIRSKETALSRGALQGFIKCRGVEQRNPANRKDTVMRDGPFPGNDVEGRAAEGPPRFRKLAVGDEPIVENVSILEAFRPLALEGKGVLGCEDAWPGLDFRRRVSADVVILSRLIREVVFHLVCLNVFAGSKVVELHVAPSFGVTFLLVVIDFIGLDDHFRRFYNRGSSKLVERAFGFLGDSTNQHMLTVRSICAGLSKTSTYQGYSKGCTTKYVTFPGENVMKKLGKYQSLQSLTVA